MNWDEIKGRWTQLTGAARSTWGDLTEDELAKAAGERDRMIGLVQEKYGVAKEEAARQVDEWTSRL